MSLGSSSHAIGVYYDSSSQHWLLQDPNRLPGFEYTNLDMLVKALLSHYFRPDESGLVMITKIETLAEHQNALKSAFLNIEENPEWARLHEISEERVNKSYPYMYMGSQNHETQWRYSQDIEWWKTALSNATATEEALGAVCTQGMDITLFNDIVKTITPTLDMLNQTKFFK